MEPESHRLDQEALDREAMLADRLAVAERVQREVDEAVAAAVEKRRAYFEWFMDHIRFEVQAQRERERIWTGMKAAFAADHEPASPGAGPSDRWAETEVEPLPLAWAAGEG